jgi:hypothetical protein
MIALAALAGAALAMMGAKPAAAAQACAPEGKVRYLCGPANVEDMVLTPGSSMIIASGMAGESGAGRLYLIDPRRKSFTTLKADAPRPAGAEYKSCPGPIDMAKLAPHGIALRPGAGGRHTLYVVNHGTRESVEVFELDAAKGEPTLTWTGCAVLPDGASGNSVAPLSGGGFVVTRFEQAGDPQAFRKMADGEKTGAVYAWRPGVGFKLVDGSAMSGDNGIETAAGGAILVNAWAEKRIYKLGPKGAKSSVAEPDFLPDNLRKGSDGQVLVAGQAAKDLKGLLASACGKSRCPHGWGVDRLNPASMTLTRLVRVDGTDAFSDATVGLRVGDEIWVGTFRGDRVAIVKAPR